MRITRFFALLLAVVMLATIAATGVLTNATSVDEIKLNPLAVGEKASGDSLYDDTEIVNIIVKLEDKPTAAAVADIGTKAASDYALTLEQHQEDVIAEIEKQMLNGNEMDINFRYTLLFNGFSFKGEYRLIEQIKAMDSVSDAYVSMSWSTPTAIEGEPSRLSSSVGLMNTQYAWNAGYTGENTAIAIIDTGITSSHTNFATIPANPVFTTSEIAQVLSDNSLNAEQMYNGTLSASNVYVSGKIPFGFNYATGTTDISHASAGNDHGTHVASIAAGNDNNARGVAYNAQIVVMQVFQGGGASWDTILAALEDCVYLDVDSLNMSLGSPAGFSTGYSDMTEVFMLLEDNGVNCSVAAGNDYDQGSNNATGTGSNLTIDPDNGIVGSPSTIWASLSIASCENSTSASMSGFSSLGVTADLKLKPELTAPGGNISAAIGGGGYGSKSGTSMAAPHIAGAMTIVEKYVRDIFEHLTDEEQVNMTNTLLMSTAVPKNNVSPRKQGAGLANLQAALSTTAYISVDGNVRPKLELGDDPNYTGIFDFSFTVNNFGSTALTYTVNPMILTADCRAVTVAGQSLYAITSDSYRNITNEISVTHPQTVTVPANGSVDINVVVDVNAISADLNEKFPNGIYIDGFICLDGTVDLSVPFLGFYGDWDKAAMIDRGYYWDEVTNSVAPHSHTVLNVAGSSNSSNSFLKLGINPYTDDDEFYADHISISPNGDRYYDAVDVVYTGLMRNSALFGYTIYSQDDPSDILYENIWEQERKGFYAYNSAFGGYGFYPLGADEYSCIEPFTGEGLSEGDTVMIRTSAWLDHEGYEIENNESGYWEFPVTIDTTAPVITYYNLEDGLLTLFVRDNHYTAYVGVYANSSYNQAGLIAEEAISEELRGKTTILQFDVGDRDTVYVKVGDYAYNTFTSAITGEGGDFDPVTLEGISIAAESYVYTTRTVNVELVREPDEANNYTCVWSVGDNNIATVQGNMLRATVTGIDVGQTTLTCVATDTATGESFTATGTIIVEELPDLNGALNTRGGTIVFTTGSSTHQFAVDMTSDADRVSAVSTNQGISNSESTVNATVQLIAGQTLKFDWRVSSEANWDKLFFFVNGVERTNISGNTSWATYSFTAPSTGNYQLSWSYRKDGSVNSGLDMGWVDEVRIVGAQYSVTFVDGVTGATIQTITVDENAIITTFPTAPTHDGYEFVGWDYNGEPITSNTIITAMYERDGRGDVNNDGNITAADALLIMRHVTGNELFTDPNVLRNADVDGDGEITGADALLTLRIAVGLTPGF